MHGEFKVPGGKLVVVDLDVEDGTIVNFRLAGDFFLEPDSALELIDAAVNGLPADAAAARIASARAAEGDELDRLRVAAHPVVTERLQVAG